MLRTIHSMTARLNISKGNPVAEIHNATGHFFSDCSGGKWELYQVVSVDGGCVSTSKPGLCASAMKDLLVYCESHLRQRELVALGPKIMGRTDTMRIHGMVAVLNVLTGNSVESIDASGKPVPGSFYAASIRGKWTLYRVKSANDVAVATSPFAVRSDEMINFLKGKLK